MNLDFNRTIPVSTSSVLSSSSGLQGESTETLVDFDWRRRRSMRKATTSLFIKSCGHVIHASCLEAYMQAQDPNQQVLQIGGDDASSSFSVSCMPQSLQHFDSYQSDSNQHGYSRISTQVNYGSAFRLFPLPALYQDLYHKTLNQACRRCHRMIGMSSGALCLLCGCLLCIDSRGAPCHLKVFLSFLFLLLFFFFWYNVGVCISVGSTSDFFFIRLLLFYSLLSLRLCCWLHHKQHARHLFWSKWHVVDVKAM
jgi:hypothetical protein